MYRDCQHVHVRQWRERTHSKGKGENVLSFVFPVGGADALALQLRPLELDSRGLGEAANTTAMGHQSALIHHKSIRAKKSAETTWT